MGESEQRWTGEREERKGDGDDEGSNKRLGEKAQKGGKQKGGKKRG